MPIRQTQLIEQMQEARAVHQYARALREQVLAYVGHAKAHYVHNAELHTALQSLADAIALAPAPDDRITWQNERHYSRHAKRNDILRERQEIARRMAGVPTLDESLAVLHAKNVLRQPLARADQPIAARSAASTRATIPNDTGEPALEFDLPESLPGDNSLLPALDIAPLLGDDIPEED